MKALRLFVASLASVALAGAAWAQATTGVTGVVKDAQGAVLPGVTVTAKSLATGTARATTSSGEGRYTIVGLQPGDYEIRAQLQGFGDAVEKSVHLNVGTNPTINLTMSPAGVTQELTVTGERELIETTESDVSTVISEQQIQNLPIAERNTITLALLTPGVSGAPYFDPTKSRDNFDGFGIGGASASSTWTLVDGGDNNDGVVGSILQFYPQDSIQEFEVISSLYKAEYGHTDGGVVNMITKSGGNDLSGGAYYLVRDKSLNGKTFPEDDAGIDKGEFHQDVFGGYLGGPISKDKIFFFGNYDYTTRDRPLTTNAPGEGPEQVPQDFTQKLFVGKLSANLTSDNFAMGRYAYQKDDTLNVNMGSNDSVDHGGLQENEYHAFLIKDQAVLGGDKLNEAFYQFNRFSNSIISNAVGSPLENQEILIESGTYSVGHNINHPQETNQDKHQLVDTFSWRSGWKGDHDLKAGFEFIHVKTDGAFSTGGPFVSFGYESLDNYLAGGPADTADVFNGPLFFVGDATNNIWSFFIQDDFKPTDRLTLNLGLRYDVETNDWNQDSRTFVTSDPLFFGGQPDTDSNNFGPRVGFAYDVEGNGKFVVRGGYGIFYQQIFWNSPIRAQFFEGELSTAESFVNPAFRPGAPFCNGSNGPNCIPVLDIPDPVAEAFVGDSGLVGVDPRIETPMSHQFSAGFGTQLPGNWGMDVDYVHTYSNAQVYRTRVAGRDNVNGLDASNMGVRARINTQDHMNAAELSYNGLLISARNHWNKLSAQLSYTFGRGEGHIARQTDQLIDDSDAGFDRNQGPNFAQRDHLFAGSLFYDLPYEFQLGAILKFQSGFAFTGFDSTLGDVDGDNSATDSIADTALGSVRGNGHRGAFRGDGLSQIDVRLSKRFTIAEKYRPQVFFEVFNLFDARNEKPDDVVTNVNSSRFGTSGNYAGQPFQAQFSVRLDF